MLLQEKLGDTYFSELSEILILVVVHNVSETVIINIYNDWDILAPEKH